MADANNAILISIGELAKRSGTAASALRFYESRGLIASVRSPAQRRQFPREVLRRIAFIKAAQTAGLTLEEIENSLATLPGQRTPTKQDWEKLSRSWHNMIEERIRSLTALRDQLSSCIGCGCLSLKSCALYNPQDIAHTRGTGPRYLMGDKSSDLV